MPHLLVMEASKQDTTNGPILPIPECRLARGRSSLRSRTTVEDIRQPLALSPRVNHSRSLEVGLLQLLRSGRATRRDIRSKPHSLHRSNGLGKTHLFILASRGPRNRLHNLSPHDLDSQDNTTRSLSRVGVVAPLKSSHLSLPLEHHI